MLEVAELYAEPYQLYVMPLSNTLIVYQNCENCSITLFSFTFLDIKMKFRMQQMAITIPVGMRMHWVGWFGHGVIMKDFTIRPLKYLDQQLCLAC